MSDETYPENILPDGPLDLDREAIDKEISFSRGAVIFNAGFLALTGALSTEVVPELVHSSEALDYANMAQYGVLATIVGSISTLAAINIKAYGNRWRQARYNRKFLDIADNEDLS